MRPLAKAVGGSVHARVPSVPPSRDPATRRRQVGAAAAVADAVRHVPYTDTPGEDYSDALVVDWVHSSAATLSHQQGHSNVEGVPLADTSTGLVLNALGRTPDSPALRAALQRRRVMLNHFDEDGVLSMWAWINREACLQHDAVLRSAARMGDFGEVLLPEYHGADVWPPEAIDDGVVHDEEAVRRGLKLFCWLRQEAAARPADEDCDGKFEYFLPRIGAVLEDGPPAGTWEEEHDKVQRGLQLVQSVGTLEHWRDVGVTVVRVPEPVHDVALASFAIGSDAVVAVYFGGRYEVTVKYTAFIELHSRPVQARLDFAPLVKVLNALEGGTSGTAQLQRWVSTSHRSLEPSVALEAADGAEASGGAQRYLQSKIPEALFLKVVHSFFEHGLNDAPPRKGGRTWAEMEAVHTDIDWDAWEWPCQA